MSDKELESERQETPKATDSGRRDTLKGIIAGGGTVVTAASLKGQWSTPVIDSVVLPAHAQTTADVGSFVASGVIADSGLIDGLVPAAVAGGCSVELCISIAANDDVTVQELVDNAVISTGSGSIAGGSFGIVVQPSGAVVTGQYNIDSDTVTGSINGCMPGNYTATRSNAPCDFSGSVTTTSFPTTGFPTTVFPTTGL